ncbi:MAG: Endonuclease/exonuclease/phosphatase [Benjaminiella poitrasii]|nr:MAG: Endonuclease/exonuclease/phosphatase [Benjaminiella poitrasii]
MNSSSLLSDPNVNTAYVTRQLAYAQKSRQASSPHHHARTAAAMARSAPVSSTVTIIDPNNPSKVFNRAVNGNNGKNTNTTTTTLGGDTSSDDLWSTLDIGGVGLNNIAPVLWSYEFLTVLYLNHNNLTELTSDVAKLVNLKTLDISGNKLKSVPPELGMLIKLQDLLLFDNNITTLPNELGTLCELEMLGLEGNPIQPEIKSLLLREGTQAVIISLRENTPVGMPPPQREWITVENSVLENDNDKLSVLCYNILCPKYATSQVFGYTPSWALNWDYRKELIISEVLGYQSDVVCLQEVAVKHYEGELGDALKERGDYDSVFFPKSRVKTMTGKNRKEVDGCAIFYKASKYNLIEHHLLEYSPKSLQRPDFKHSDDIYNRVMTRDNVAVMIILEHKESLQRVLMVNSHIFWDPHYADVKLVQVGMMMDEIEDFAAKHLVPPSTSPDGPTYASVKQLPTIICGDFNSVPESGVYEFLSKGKLPPHHPDFGNYSYGGYTSEGLSHNLSLKSSYSHVGELDITNYTPEYKGTLDYIWYTNNTLEVVSLLGGIRQDYLDKVVGFPNAHFPSDHIPLMAEIRIKKPSSHHEPIEPNFGFTTNSASLTKR